MKRLIDIHLMVHIFDTSIFVKEKKMKKYVVNGDQASVQQEKGPVSVGWISIGDIEAKNKTEAKKIFRERCAKFEGLKMTNLEACIQDEE